MAIFVSLTLLALPACFSLNDAPAPATPVLAKELVLYNWEDYMPQSVLEAFEGEYGVEVTIRTYESQAEAVQNIRSGAVVCDVAVIENDLLPALIAGNLLAKIDRRNLPNFENISADFRELSYDPENSYSVPYNWGTSGLIVRSDLVEAPITRWADLWDPRHAGQIGIRNDSTELISIALYALGYPLNSENPAHLEAALARLIELKANSVLVPPDPQGMLEALESGQIVILQGWNGDALEARKQYPAIQYVLPKEGTMLWGDSFVIPAASPNSYTAEVFLNFVLKPEIGAQTVEANHYPSANQSAQQFIDPAILSDPIVYPTLDFLKANDFYAPLSAEGKQLYAAIWERYLKASP